MITAAHVHLLTHTARMLAVLDASPDHVRLKEYRRQMRIYAGQWAALDADDQSAAIAAAIETGGAGITPDTIAASVAVMEA